MGADLGPGHISTERDALCNNCQSCRSPLPRSFALDRGDAPYRWPLAANLALKAWNRMEDFIKIVVPFLIAGGALYGLLEYYGLTDILVKPFSFLTAGWLGLPPQTIIPLLYGFLQKDLVIAMLANALGTPDFGSALTKI